MKALLRLQRADISRCAALLVAGLLCAALVSIACALIHTQPWRAQAVSSPPAEWPREVPPHWPSLPAGVEGTDAHRASNHRLSRVGASSIYVSAQSRDGSRTWAVEVSRFGLPLPALQTSHFFEDAHGSTGPAPQQHWFSGGIELDGWVADLGSSTGVNYLPLMPVWWGLAADSVFFATVMLLSSRGLSALAAKRRRRAGLCLRCRYPLLGRSPCPECGHKDAPE